MNNKLRYHIHIELNLARHMLSNIYVIVIGIHCIYPAVLTYFLIHNDQGVKTFFLLQNYLFNKSGLSILVKQLGLIHETESQVHFSEQENFLRWSLFLEVN